MIDKGEPVVEFEESPQKELEDEPCGLERERLIPRKDAEFVFTLPDALLVGFVCPVPWIRYSSNTSEMVSRRSGSSVSWKACQRKGWATKPCFLSHRRAFDCSRGFSSARTHFLSSLMRS